MIAWVTLFVCAILFVVFTVLHHTLNEPTEAYEGYSVYQVGMMVSFVLMIFAFVYIMYKWWKTRALYESIAQNEEIVGGDIFDAHNISFIPPPRTGEKSHLEHALSTKNPEERLLKVRWLLEKGADPNIPILNGMSLLHQAIVLKDLELVNLLLRNGADPNAKLWDGKTPLFMLNDYHKQTGQKIMQLLIDHGANVDAKTDDRGMTPLLHYLYTGHLTPALQILTIAKSSINPNSVTEDGNNALYYAVDYVVNDSDFRGQRVYEKLMEMPVDVNHVNVVGETILHKLARSYGHNAILPIVKELKEKGARTDIPNKHGQTVDDVIDSQLTDV